MIEFTLGKLCFPDIFNDFGHTYNVLKNEVNGNNLIVEHCVLVPCSNWITDCSIEFDWFWSVLFNNFGKSFVIISELVVLFTLLVDRIESLLLLLFLLLSEFIR